MLHLPSPRSSRPHTPVPRASLLPATCLTRTPPPQGIHTLHIHPGTGAHHPASALHVLLKNQSHSSFPYISLPPAVPAPAASASPAAAGGIPRRVVYMPSCVTRMMGPAAGDSETASVHEKIMSLFGKAGYEVIVPEGVSSQCCGMIFNRWVEMRPGLTGIIDVGSGGVVVCRGVWPCRQAALPYAPCLRG